MCVAGLTRMEYQYGVSLLSTWWMKNGYGQWLISSCLCLHFPEIWCSWLGDRKSIQSVKKLTPVMPWGSLLENMEQEVQWATGKTSFTWKVSIETVCVFVYDNVERLLETRLLLSVISFQAAYTSVLVLTHFISTYLCTKVRRLLILSVVNKLSLVLCRTWLECWQWGN